MWCGAAAPTLVPLRWHVAKHMNIAKHNLQRYIADTDKVKLQGLQNQSAMLLLGLRGRTHADPTM
jgi:hypothetical protein